MQCVPQHGRARSTRGRAILFVDPSAKQTIRLAHGVHPCAQCVGASFCSVFGAVCVPLAPLLDSAQFGGLNAANQPLYVGAFRPQKG